MFKKIGHMAVAVAIAITPIWSAAEPTATTQQLELAGQKQTPQLNRPRISVQPTPTLDLSARAYVLMDFNSGQVIASKDVDERMKPASLTKMMTMYIVSSALKSGSLKLDDTVRISEKAWRTGGSRMFVKEGSQVPVQELIQGIIIASGNDACVALAEHIAGTEAAFANLMNQAAAELGMTNSHFIDSTGLPSENHYSTPRDIAILTYALIKDFPEYYHWYQQKWFTYNGIKQPNRNRLLWRDSSVDGVKTGHTDQAGYCLATSAKRNDVRLIAVIMGSKNDASRASDSEALINYGFRFFEAHKLFSGRTPLSTPRVWGGEEKTTELGIDKDFHISIPSGQYSQLKATLTINNELNAPLVAGQQYGTVDIKLNDKVIASRALIALKDNPAGGLWSRTRDKVARLFHNWFS